MTVTVTLQFSSIAEAVAELSKISPKMGAHVGANEVIEQAREKAAAPAAAPKPKKGEGPSPAPAPAEPAATEPTAQAPAAAPVSSQPTSAALAGQAAAAIVATPPAALAAVSYDQLRPQVLKLGAVNRAALLELLKKWGVGSAKELPAERWGEALADVEAALKVQS